MVSSFFIGKQARRWDLSYSSLVKWQDNLPLVKYQRVILSHRSPKTVNYSPKGGLCELSVCSMKPYSNGKEFLQDSMKHGPYIKDEIRDCWRFPTKIQNNGVWLDDYRFCNYIALSSYCWQDGKRCCR